MASSSPWRDNDVFPSFDSADDHPAGLRMLLEFSHYTGVTMYNDEEPMKRSGTISPARTRAIRNSRTSLVVLSKNYALSSRCLDELLVILKCKEDLGQSVVTIFYGVDPSSVGNQTGEFGRAFDETCARKTDEERRKWSRALKDVSTIDGEHFQPWDCPVAKIERLTRDLLHIQNGTICGDFDGMVGREAHMNKLDSLFHLDDYDDEAMIVGICGPSGIGKTTIARAFYNRHSSSFELTCFMENIRINHHNVISGDPLKLRLQKELLSKVSNQNDISLSHLGVIKDRLREKKVLIVLDDVDKLWHLEALADETTWFGPGSRIILTTKDIRLLTAYGIRNVYHVGLPSPQEALEILCRHAFRQSYPPDGFRELALSIVKLCGTLPLSLRNVGAPLRGKQKEYWKVIEQSLRDSFEPSSSNKGIRKSLKSPWSTVMSFLVYINLLLEITSAVADQLSSIRKPYFARTSLVMSILSVVFSILDLSIKIRAAKACFRCKWPVPWFHYPRREYRRIFGNFTDTVILFCGVGQLITSTINCSFLERGRDGPIKFSIMPLFFAIAMAGAKFREKPDIHED